MTSLSAATGNRGYIVHFLTIGSVFVAANLIASKLNHIDDTDETYGYYEPLHYLLYGVGMQTWEYSPFYAIRTYTFITPFLALGSLLKSLNFSKLDIFYGIRISLGLLAATSETFYVSAIYDNFGKTVGDMTLLFMLFSSGVLYTSTALLPSAVIMSLVMLACASLLQRRYLLVILIGCISVLWSGWPFVGIIYLPFGMHIIAETCKMTSDDTKKVATSEDNTTYKALKRVCSLCVKGAIILTSVAGSAAAVDFYMYNRRYTDECAA